MNVRAKFFVSNVSKSASSPAPAPGQEVAVVKLNAVVGGSPENESWSRYTPQGSIEMTITNPAAIEVFEPGEAFFVDFIPYRDRQAV